MSSQRSRHQKGTFSSVGCAPTAPAARPVITFEMVQMGIQHRLEQEKAVREFEESENKAPRCLLCTEKLLTDKKRCIVSL